MAVTEPTKTIPDLRTKKLLIADDEEAIRSWLGESLSRAGFQILAAKDGVEAWESYQKSRPQVVILDIYMPRMNGLEVLRRIKEVDEECPIIIITGFMHYEQLVRTSSHKPNGFITKPFKIDILLKKVMEFV